MQTSRKSTVSINQSILHVLRPPSNRTSTKLRPQLWSLWILRSQQGTTFRRANLYKITITIQELTVAAGCMIALARLVWVVLCRMVIADRVSNAAAVHAPVIFLV